MNSIYTVKKCSSNGGDYGTRIMSILGKIIEHTLYNKIIYDI